MKKLLALSVLLLLALAVPALAQEAEDLTASSEVTVNSKLWTQHRISDRNWDTYWQGDGNRKLVEINSPEPVHGLYICWLTEPRDFAIEQMMGGAWQKTVYEASKVKHGYYKLDGARQVRVRPEGGSGKWFGISELFVLGEGELPPYVQTWTLPDRESDLLLLFAHPDDEALFFGGALPRYAGQENLDVVAAVMTPATDTRKSELLNSLWSMGVRNYPVFGPFYDTYTTKLDVIYKRLGKAKAQGFVISLFREHRPKVVLTHDINGEYGHAMHKMCADTALTAFDAAADENRFPESAKQYGVHQVSKLYLHLYPENRLVMDWDAPLSAFSGKTGYEVAKEAYLFHVTQQGYEQFQVEPRESLYSSYAFGLAMTRVGADVNRDDFFENISGYFTVSD